MLLDALIKLARPVTFRGKHRLLNRLLPRAGEVDATLFGTQVKLDLADHIQRSMYIGSFERAETAAVRRVLKPGDCFVDVGANAGYFTFLAASRVGQSGRVVAVEPSPAMYRKLASAVAANGLSRVQAHNLALGEQDGTLPLYIPAAAHGNHSPTMLPHDGSGDPVQVPVRRLDDLLDECGVDRVDLMKVDVEGYEPRVLAGAARALAAGRIRAVLCEFNECWLRMAGSSSAELWARFAEAGFVRADPGGDGDPAFHDHYFDNHLLVRR